MTEGLAAVNRALDARDYQAARSHLGPLLSEHPGSPNVLWTAGRFLGLLGKYAEASCVPAGEEGDPSLSHIDFDVRGNMIRLRDVPRSMWAPEVLEGIERAPC